MPTYDYRCDACQHTFEEFQSFSEEPLKKCPACGKKKLQRLFGTGAAVLFKGSGFYETDYRSDGYKSAAKADQEASKPAASSSTDSTSKPAGENSKSSTPKKPKSGG
jgi:putative FmdB family regulatory protein